MSGYIGADNTARKIKELYIGVGNTARVVQKAYIGVDNVARLWYTRGTQLGSLAVGSSVYFKVNNVRTEWLVVQQGNPSTSIYDSSCDGTWLLMKNIYENRAWNRIDFNSYAGSTIYSYLSSTFLALLEAGVQSLVQQVRLPYTSGSGEDGTVKTGANGILSKVFLLSGTEVGYTDNYANIEGAKLSYFLSGTSTAAKAKRTATLNAKIAKWWLRSPSTYSNASTVSTYYTDTSGALSYIRASNTYGIRPCIILPKGTLLDDNMNVVGG